MVQKEVMKKLFFKKPFGAHLALGTPFFAKMNQDEKPLKIK